MEPSEGPEGNPSVSLLTSFMIRGTIFRFLDLLNLSCADIKGKSDTVVGDGHFVNNISTNSCIYRKERKKKFHLIFFTNENSVPRVVQYTSHVPNTVRRFGLGIVSLVHGLHDQLDCLVIIVGNVNNSGPKSP